MHPHAPAPQRPISERRCVQEGPSAAVSGAAFPALSAAHLCTDSWFARMWRGVAGNAGPPKIAVYGDFRSAPE